MKKFLYIFTGLILLLLTVFALQTQQASAESNADYVRGEILVKFKEGTSSRDMGNTHKKLGGKLKHTISTIDVQVVDIGNKNIGQAISAYAKNGAVEFVEPNFIAKALTNDADFDNQWGLHNYGQQTCNNSGDICTTGTDDADIDAPEAWKISTSNAEILIAILDSGIDQDHPDLIDKIVANIDFTGSSDWDDKYGHGTHVAGIAAAETDNEIGVAGIGHDASLMNVKVLGDNGYGAYSWIADGIIWATNNGAKVINMSLGGSQRSLTLQAAINQAWENGVVLVAAAGNSNNPSRTYPAYYSKCIAVAATDNNDVKASFSSYGKWVDVAAPGENIYSTFPNHSFYLQTVYGRSQNYDFGSGTSMSTPYVSGLAALVWSTNLGTDNSAVRSRIESTADKVSGTGIYWKWGRINACNAVGGNCSGEPSPTPTPEPSPEPTPTSEPNQCSECFKDICDGRCHPSKEGPLCPDCY
jgi:thermitase